MLHRIGHVPLRRLTATHLHNLCEQLCCSGGHDGRPRVPKTMLNVQQVLRTAIRHVDRQGRSPHAGHDHDLAGKAALGAAEDGVLEAGQGHVRGLDQRIGGHPPGGQHVDRVLEVVSSALR